MKLRNKLALSYTSAFVFLLGLTFIAIFLIAKHNRKKEFHQRFKDRTLLSFKLFVGLHNLSDDALDKLDKSLVNGVRKNTYLFDSVGNLIYSSSDSAISVKTDEIVRWLQSNRCDTFLATKDGELFGVKFTASGRKYIGVALAEDKFGKDTERFLAWLLTGSFLVSVTLIILLSFYLSTSITAPITILTREVESMSPGNLSRRLPSHGVKTEVAVLAAKFNELLANVERAFKFQYKFISYLSHEMKMPLSIMHLKADNAMLSGDNSLIRANLAFQMDAIIGLSNIINAVLEISKKETQSGAFSDIVRVDQLLFDCVDEITILNSIAKFDLAMEQEIDSEALLSVEGNSVMLKLAFSNLLKNAVSYSANKVVKIVIESKRQHLQISVINDGVTLTEEERIYMFSYLFRGAGSRRVEGAGLGLSLTEKIITLHNGSIDYSVTKEGLNCFTVCL